MHPFDKRVKLQRMKEGFFYWASLDEEFYIYRSTDDRKGYLAKIPNGSFPWLNDRYLFIPPKGTKSPHEYVVVSEDLIAHIGERVESEREEEKTSSSPEFPSPYYIATSFWDHERSVLGNLEILFAEYVPEKLKLHEEQMNEWAKILFLQDSVRSLNEHEKDICARAVSHANDEKIKEQPDA